MNPLIIKDIFNKEQRLKIIKDVQPLLVDGRKIDIYYQLGGRTPGRQTHATLHLHPTFQPILYYIKNVVNKRTKLDLEVDRAWINWTNGKNKDRCWHIHNCDYSLVYYIKTFPFFQNGTLFEDGFITAPQNSLLIFPSHLKHTAPSSPLPIGRYTLAMDLVKKQTVHSDK